MGQQIGEHLKVVDALKVLRNYASPELRQTLDKELQLAQTHLQQAKQIEEQLQDRPSERVSRRPDSNK
jgi:thymidine phosphorylase